MKCILNNHKTDVRDLSPSLWLYGIGVYSSFIVKNNKVLGWHHHLERLQQDALQFLGLDVDSQTISESVINFVDSIPNDDSITCRATIFPENFSLAEPQNASKPQILVTGRNGSSVGGLPLNLEMISCHRPFAQHKITNISSAMKLRGNAKKAGFDDPVFTDNGFFTEGPTWNIFFIINDRVVTPPLTSNLLPGVARRIILEGFKDEIIESPVAADDLAHISAAFVTNSAIGAKPVASINRFELAVDHPLIEKIQSYYASLAWQNIR